MPQAQLTPRDHLILRDTWLYRYASAKQVSRLHFGHIKLAQRRLRKLHQAKYLDRFRPARATKRGFRTWWYRLAHQGAKTIAEQIGEAPEDITPPTRPPTSMAFLAHHSLITDFRIWLREACQKHPEKCFGYEFIPSYEETRDNTTDARTRRIAQTIPDTTRALIPDGAFTLHHQPSDKAVLFYLEADRATEPLTGKHRSAIQKKLEAYAAVYDAHAEENHQGLFTHPFQGFRVLALVPNNVRRDAFLQLAEAVDLAPLLWATTHDILEETGDLDAPAWHLEPGGDLHALSE